MYQAFVGSMLHVPAFSSLSPTTALNITALSIGDHPCPETGLWGCLVDVIERAYLGALAYQKFTENVIVII